MARLLSLQFFLILSRIRAIFLLPLPIILMACGNSIHNNLQDNLKYSVHKFHGSPVVVAKQNFNATPTSEINSDEKVSAKTSGESQVDKEPTTVSLTIDGVLKVAPEINKAQDESGGTVIVLSATIAKFDFSIPFADSLNLAKAEKRTFISPALNGCVLTDDSLLVVKNGTNVSNLQKLSFAARDTSGTKVCSEFMDAVQKHGFTIQYDNVPLLSGANPIKTVYIHVTSP